MDIKSLSSLDVDDVNGWSEFIESEVLFVKALGFEIDKYKRIKDVLGALSKLLDEEGFDKDVVRMYDEVHMDIRDNKLLLLMELEKVYSSDVNAWNKILERILDERGWR